MTLDSKNAILELKIVQSFVYGRLLVPDLLLPPVSRTKVVVLSVETALGSVAFSLSCGKRGTVCPQGAEPSSSFPSG